MPQERFPRPDDLGPTGGAIWTDEAEWRRRCDPTGCVICRSGPLDVIAEFTATWTTAPADAPLPGYVCVVSRRHVVEPYQLPVSQGGQFWREAMLVAEAVASVTRPIKVNYEIHGNTVPHLHLHIFPRTIDDPYVGGPIDPRKASFRRSPDALAIIKEAIIAAQGQRA